MKHTISFTFCVAVALQTAVALAVELNPSHERVLQAAQQGTRDGLRERGKPDSTTAVRDFTMNVFGDPNVISGQIDCGGWGTIQTKLWTIRARSRQYAKQYGRPLPQPRIEGILTLTDMVIVYSACIEYGEGQPRIWKIALKQGDKLLQPEKVQKATDAREFIIPERIGDRRLLHSTTTASFSYGTFDPLAHTTIIFFDENGPNWEFTVQLADFP